MTLDKNNTSDFVLDTDKVVDWMLEQEPRFKDIENFREIVNVATDKEAEFINSLKGRVYYVQDAAKYVKDALKEQTFDIETLIKVFDLEFEYISKFTNLVK